MDDDVPTSTVLGRLLRAAPADRVALAWVLDNLHDRSFGIVMLILGLLALVPGLSTFVGLLLAWPAVQMVLARPTPGLPRWVARRTIPTSRVASLVTRAIPLMRRIEALIRPRWWPPLYSTKRVVGVIILVLGLSMIAPLPFSHVPPALAVMLLALAYVEKDGLMLLIALAFGLLSLAISIGAGWGAVALID